MSFFSNIQSKFFRNKAKIAYVIAFFAIIFLVYIVGPLLIENGYEFTILSILVFLIFGTGSKITGYQYQILFNFREKPEKIIVENY
jgi:hypothetical protein